MRFTWYIRLTVSEYTVKYFESPNHPENYPNNHSEVMSIDI